MAKFAARSDHADPIEARTLRLLVIVLFFMIGGITGLNDVITPKLKALFALDYTEAMLVSVCFFAAYGIVSIPAAQLVKRCGYLRSAVIGLLLMMMGCLLFIPAIGAGYAMFLLALFVMASGVVVVQVVANPLISLLGSPSTAHSTLTFAQAFNSLGSVVFPKIGAVLILGGVATVSATDLGADALERYRRAETTGIVQIYLVLAVVLAAIAGLVWSSRDRLRGEQHEPTDLRRGLDLLTRPRFALGALCICLYVGAEVAIASLIVNYMQLARVLHVSASEAGGYIPCYWAAALIGRFAGSAVLARLDPGDALAGSAAGALALLLISINSNGLMAAWSLVAIGLMNAIMFPTIFSLACGGLGARTADGSGIINTAIVGGAAVPLLTGRVADVTGSLTLGLFVPAGCYCTIIAFGRYSRRVPAGRSPTNTIERKMPDGQS